MIHVVLQPEQLAGFYADLSNLGDYFALIRDDGAFLVRYPTPPRIPAQRANAVGPASMLAANPERGSLHRRLGDRWAPAADRLPEARQLSGLCAWPVSKPPSIRSEWLEALGRAAALRPAGHGAAHRRADHRAEPHPVASTTKRRSAPVAEEELRRAQGLETLGQMTGGVAPRFQQSADGRAGHRRADAAHREGQARGALAQTQIEAADGAGERLTSQLPLLRPPADAGPRSRRRHRAPLARAQRDAAPLAAAAISR